MVDPVVKEYPVYLVESEEGPEVYLLQHPVRAATRGNERYICGRIRKEYKMLELETPANTRGPHYDDTAPRKLQLKRRKLVSALVQPVSNYAAGFMRGGVLNLVPLDTTLQMRPDLSHVDDDIDQDHKKNKKNKPKPPRSGGSEPTVQPNTYAHKRQQQESVPWKELTVENSDSPAARIIIDRFAPDAPDTEMMRDDLTE